MPYRRLFACRIGASARLPGGQPPGSAAIRDRLQCRSISASRRIAFVDGRRRGPRTIPAGRLATDTAVFSLFVVSRTPYDWECPTARHGKLNKNQRSRIARLSRRPTAALRKPTSSALTSRLTRKRRSLASKNAPDVSGAPSPMHEPLLDERSEPVCCALL
jgi:hypothetical protein